MNFFSAFLLPGMFGLLALAPVIIVLYLLKLKRKPEIVPSTLLWRRSVQDMIANAPFQRLRNNLLLWIQLLILLILVAALARPLLRLSGLGGKSIILLVDMSASMQTVEDDGRTRLDKARDLAYDAIDGMSTGETMLARLTSRDEMMVMGFAGKPVPLQPMTQDKSALRAAVASIEPMDTEADLTDLGYILEEKTMVVREGALEPNENARVILISDGGLGPTVSSLVDVVNLDYTSVGEVEDNVGFASIDVRESFTGQFEYQVFATILNSRDIEEEVFVELQVQGELLDIKKVNIEPRETGNVVFTVGEDVRGLATLMITDHSDSYELDDIVYANIAPPSEMKVLLVSDSGTFIERYFAVDSKTTVEVVRPAEYTPKDDYDITVFDGFSPPSIAPGNYIFVNALPPDGNGYTARGDRITQPQVIDWSLVHPITKDCNFERLIIGEMLNFNHPQGSVSLVEAIDGDIINYHETDVQKILVIGFDINLSYWPVDRSFPIFMSNVVDYWSRTGSSSTKAAFTTGETIPIIPPRDAATAEIQTPSGDVIEYDLEGQSTIYLTQTEERGLYTVSYDDGSVQTIPINAISLLESDTKVVDELQIADKVIEASAGEVKTQQEIWHWLAMLALGFLLLEWGIYCRRSFM